MRLPAPLVAASVSCLRASEPEHALPNTRVFTAAALVVVTIGCLRTSNVDVELRPHQVLPPPRKRPTVRNIRHRSSSMEDLTEGLRKNHPSMQELPQ